MLIILTIAALAAAVWLFVAAVFLVAVHRVTSEPYPSQPVETPCEAVFDIEKYQWQDVA